MAGRETERTPPVSETARKRATAAYLDLWRDTAEAAKTSDWKSPRLARHATGEALKAIMRGMYADHRNGLIAKGMPENAPKVTKPPASRSASCRASAWAAQYSGSAPNSGFMRIRPTVE
ncbi:hypothetical protein GCM10012286_64610 [Streptomyces lasiicapitis]|uniref:Uncharacterized protein n=1 Tax=Streptomyces lasiicapitis TaxID=1923961 RepID=A0ABQ2MQU1_9ACTN|nr:hypothetical protein GCM10012286_64610 [Streptomyces lasiicapitis]